MRRLQEHDPDRMCMETDEHLNRGVCIAPMLATNRDVQDRRREFDVDDHDRPTSRCQPSCVYEPPSRYCGIGRIDDQPTAWAGFVTGYVTDAGNW